MCGEPVPRGALACPHCGADERAGWDEEASVYDGVDLPDGAERATGRARGGLRWYWMVAAVVLIVALVVFGIGL